MAIKNDREYRNLGNLQVDESNEVVGYASTFDTYMLYEENGVKLYERIDPKAFDDADMSDVVFLRDHAGRVLARTKNGSVQLWTDEHGLASKTNLGLTGAAKEMLEDISVGNYTQMSFSFVVKRDHYDWINDEECIRVIDEVKKLYDISAVAFPANPYTEIGLNARDAFHGVMEKRQAERLAAEKRERSLKELALRVKLMKGD